MQSLRQLHTKVRSSSIHNRPQVATTQTPIGGWMETKALCTQDGMLFSMKEEEVLTHSTAGGRYAQ